MTPPRLFHSLLCPVDFSKHSQTALRFAAHLARKGGRLTALFVSDQLLLEAAGAAAYDTRALTRESERELRRFVDRTLGTTSKVDVTCLVVPGEPAEMILDIAARTSADLIVIGTQGLSGAARWIFGSTTAGVLRASKIPVLAVPPDLRGRTVPASWPGRIVAALDLSAHSARDGAAAAQVALALNAELLLVHAIKATQAPGWFGATARRHDRTRQIAASQRLEKIAKGLPADINARSLLLAGDPVDQIRTLTADPKTGLLIVFLRAGRGMFGPPQGSITYDALGGASTPILALPGDWNRGRKN